MQGHSQQTKDKNRQPSKWLTTQKYDSVQKALSQKQAFLNTICFVFFELNTEEDFENFIDICTEEEYFSTIQMACPYIFRYLAVAMILSRTHQRYGRFDLYRLVDSINRNVELG